MGHYKTPKRLKEIIPLLEILIWRHGKCRYRHLRDTACPSKVQSSCRLCVHMLIGFCSLKRIIILLTRVLSLYVMLHTCLSLHFIEGRYALQDMLSEPSIQPQSQMSLGNTSVDTNGYAILPTGLTQAKQQIETKPRFAEFMCTRYEVNLSSYS